MKPLYTLIVISLCAVILTGCHIVCASDTAETRKEELELTPLEDGTGYSLYSNIYGVKGTLTKKPDSDEPWKLKGEISLPSSGYSVKKPEVLIAESYPEQVSITLTVLPPPAGAIVLPAFFWNPFEAEIQVSEEAQFTIILKSPFRRPPRGDDKKMGRPYPPGYSPRPPGTPQPSGRTPGRGYPPGYQPRKPGKLHPDVIPLFPPENKPKAPEGGQPTDTALPDTTP